MVYSAVVLSAITSTPRAPGIAAAAMSSTPQDKAFIPFIHVARGLAALLVVYCHLVGGMVLRFQQSWLPERLFREYFIVPLQVSQNFGFLGVALFFVISGFVITHVAGVSSTRDFLIKRAFRIYPPLVAAILIVLAALWAGARMGLPGYTSVPFSLKDVLLGMTLLDVIVPIPRGVLDVGWTLTIEVVFYLHAAVLLPVLRTRPALAAALLVAWGVWAPHELVALNLRYGHPPIRQLAEMVHYLPLFAIGVVSAAWHTGRLRGTWVFPCVLACLGAYTANLVDLKPWALAPNQMFPVQAAYAAAVFFVMALTLRDLRLSVAAKWAGDVSYSLYLVHIPIGVLVATLAFPVVGIAGAIVASVAAVFAGATLMNRLIEIPSQRLGRRVVHASGFRRRAPHPIEHARQKGDIEPAKA